MLRNVKPWPRTEPGHTVVNTIVRADRYPVCARWYGSNGGWVDWKMYEEADVPQYAKAFHSLFDDQIRLYWP